MENKVELIKKELEKEIEEGSIKCNKAKESNDRDSFVAWSEHISTCGKILTFINSLADKDIELEIK